MAEDEFDFSDIDFTPFIRPNYFEKGMDELKAEVGENNRFAAFELGRRFRAKNELNTAYQYFSLSAELGDTGAPMEAALIADRQHRDHDAIHFLEMQIERTDSAKAHVLLGKYYTLGKAGNFISRSKKAFGHYLSAAQQGDAEAQFYTSLAYCHGEGVSKSMREYVFWLRCAQLNGWKPAAQRIYKCMSQREYTQAWKEFLAEADKRISQHEEYIEEYIRSQIRKELDEEEQK